MLRILVAWEREVPAQMPSSTSDLGLKLRGPSQKSPCVASRRDINGNQTNLKFVYFVYDKMYNNNLNSLKNKIFHLCAAIYASARTTPETATLFPNFHTKPLAGLWPCRI
ncbi:hypothetical protein AVEN_43948-1 [Araneus ventricosus]|uniref:Uncharacterized protein n=1 Tax=Araneus ventricosus TaxID=182803 RepID=A0A4Y2A1T6_ARAVE|nr:hypothetical protein AVEN_43948-1 [Araneus ventricosus]